MEGGSLTSRRLFRCHTSALLQAHFPSSSALLRGLGSSYLRTSSPAFVLPAISQQEVSRRVAGAFFLGTLTSLLQLHPPSNGDDTPLHFQFPSVPPKNPLPSPYPFIPRDANSSPLILTSRCLNLPCLPPYLCSHLCNWSLQETLSTEPFGLH